MHLIHQYKFILLTTGVISVILFTASLLLIPTLIKLIPENYFIKKSNPRNKNILFLIIKNFLGYFLLVCGIAMLFLPGQGIITIVISIIFIDFPGKRKLELHIFTMQPVRRQIEAIRKKGGVPPLQFPEDKT